MEIKKGIKQEGVGAKEQEWGWMTLHRKTVPKVTSRRAARVARAELPPALCGVPLGPLSGHPVVLRPVGHVLCGDAADQRVSCKGSRGRSVGPALGPPEPGTRGVGARAERLVTCPAGGGEPPWVPLPGTGHLPCSCQKLPEPLEGWGRAQPRAAPLLKGFSPASPPSVSWPMGLAFPDGSMHLEYFSVPASL